MFSIFQVFQHLWNTKKDDFLRQRFLDEMRNWKVLRFYLTFLIISPKGFFVIGFRCEIRKQFAFYVSAISTKIIFQILFAGRRRLDDRKSFWVNILVVLILNFMFCIIKLMKINLLDSFGKKIFLKIMLHKFFKYGFVLYLCKGYLNDFFKLQSLH